MSQIGLSNIFHISQIGKDIGMVGKTTFFKSVSNGAVLRRQGKMFIKLDPVNYADLYTEAGIDPEGGGEGGGTDPESPEGGNGDDTEQP